MLKILFVIATSLFLAGCSISNSKPAITEETAIVESPTPTESAYVPSDPIELFLIEMARVTGIPFENPVKADIFWNEGDSSNSLRTYFGDSFLINKSNSRLESEKVVADYLIEKGFVKMGFNGSIGENSLKMGYRKDDMICKTDYDIYPDEENHHLVVYCTDATKGTLRQ
jgi:hypothetical protein